ncbi:MAG TPA: VWA domain-containing protein, partial [Planctomycetaceae bacterium]|nr:VWA domain-containing protein [Planctomycetaceae bacterium]
MAFFRRMLEWYLGLPRAQAGQSTDWRFEFQSYHGSWVSAASLLLACAAIAYVIAIYWRDAAGVSRRMRALLMVLRLAVVGLAALSLFQVTLSVGRIGLPVIALLIDNSASMGLDDRYPDEQTNELADRLVHESGVAAKTRLGLAQALLTRNDGQFLRQLLKHHTLRLYRFSDTAVRMAPRDFAGPDDIPEMAQKIRELKAEGNQTRPGPAVRKVLEDFRGSPPAAIVLFSDGVASTGDADRLSPAAEAAAASFVPIDTVGLGSEQPTRDIQLYDVTAEDLAFVGDPYVVSGKIKADGFAGRPAAVRLVERDSGRVLSQTTVNLGADSAVVPFELSYVPNAAGEMDVAIEVPPLPDESNRENNREMRHLSVRKEKIRVLLADSSPRWEFRYLKTLFERDPTVSLKTVLQEADVDYAAEDKTALAHFPLNRDDLFGYDVLILGDVNPALLGTSTMELVRDFVRDSGGGLLMIAGSSFNPLAYRGTPLEALIPLDLGELQSLPEQTLAEQGFRPELTIDGLRGTGIFRMA